MKNNEQIIQTDKQQISACLSMDEKNKIDHLLEHYPQASGASIDALKVIQKHRGWVSDTAIAALAVHMNIPLSDLDSVATFYNLIFRRPVGKVLLHPCNGVSCLLMGYRKIHQRLQQNLNISDGETSSDGRITLIPLPCLGACDKAPVMLQNEHLHKRLQTNDIDLIIKNLDQDQTGQKYGGADNDD